MTLSARLTTVITANGCGRFTLFIGVAIVTNVAVVTKTARAIQPLVAVVVVGARVVFNAFCLASRTPTYVSGSHTLRTVEARVTNTAVVTQPVGRAKRRLVHVTLGVAGAGVELISVVTQPIPRAKWRSRAVVVFETGVVFNPSGLTLSIVAKRSFRVTVIGAIAGLADFAGLAEPLRRAMRGFNVAMIG